MDHFGDGLSRQSIALVLTTRNKDTTHYIYPEYERQTEKAVHYNSREQKVVGSFTGQYKIEV